MNETGRFFAHSLGFFALANCTISLIVFIFIRVLRQFKISTIFLIIILAFLNQAFGFYWEAKANPGLRLTVAFLLFVSTLDALGL